jgi:hypothetical protein
MAKNVSMFRTILLLRKRIRMAFRASRYTPAGIFHLAKSET